MKLFLCFATVLHAASTGSVGSAVCGQCHPAIARRYSATPMALTSGLAISAPVPDQTFGAGPGYRYSVVHQDGKLSLEMSKANDPAPVRRDLAYFIGSGAAARSYLIAVDSFLYEAPATWYSRPHAWALSPGYQRYSDPFLARAIAPACLECHATGVRALPKTQNGYREPPFEESGIGCERCHGPGGAHAISRKRSDIVNPVSLPAERRDSVCAQCHLSGEIRVERAGRSIHDFVPGDNLADYALAFVRAAPSAGMKVTSHVENLAQSACSRGSGQRLWCGTCHDPHFVPAPAEKTAWFRAKCQTCHAPSVCGRGNDCIACHMPASGVKDADHVVYTDHSIPRRPAVRKLAIAAAVPLIAFGSAVPTLRDRAVAYAIVALREQNRFYSAQAFSLLKEAEKQDSDDPQILSYLADLYKTGKDEPAANRLYKRLYSVDRSLSAGSANLGAWSMEQGRNEEAIQLFREALAISPGLVLVRENLAVALLRTGHPAEAQSEIERARRYNPWLKFGEK